MTIIPWLRGVNNSGQFLAAVSTPNDHTVEIKPLNQELHAMTVNTADTILIHRDLKKLLDKCGINPPPPGTQLTVAHVNERLSAAGMTSDERISVKRSLADLKLLSEGPAYNIWKQS